jgi:hypothetical protein
MDGEGNARVENNLFVGGDQTVAGNISVTGDSAISGNSTVGLTLDVAGNAHFFSNAIVDGELDVANLVISGSETIDGSLTVKGDVRATSFTTGVTGIVGGNITCVSPGRFVGNGSGLTNLPITTIPAGGAFSFSTDVVTPSIGNRFTGFDPPLLAGVASIECEMSGKPPGLYFWKTTTNIEFQQLFNSASGYVFWDGTKVSGETTWSLTQASSTAPASAVYSLTRSYLFFETITGFYITIESTNLSVDFGYTFTATFYLIAPISS